MTKLTLVAMQGGIPATTKEGTRVTIKEGTLETIRSPTPATQAHRGTILEGEIRKGGAGTLIVQAPAHTPGRTQAVTPLEVQTAALEEGTGTTLQGTITTATATPRATAITASSRARTATTKIIDYHPSSPYLYYLSISSSLISTL